MAEVKHTISSTLGLVYTYHTEVRRTGLYTGRLAELVEELRGLPRDSRPCASWDQVAELNSQLCAIHSTRGAQLSSVLSHSDPPLPPSLPPPSDASRATPRHILDNVAASVQQMLFGRADQYSDRDHAEGPRDVPARATSPLNEEYSSPAASASAPPADDSGSLQQAPASRPHVRFHDAPVQSV